MLVMTIIGHHKMSFSPKLPHKAWDAKSASSLFNFIVRTNVLSLSNFANSIGVASPKTTLWVSMKSSNVFAMMLDFEVPYEGQPSTMESLAHSKTILAKHVKETQKVYQTHATNAKN